MDATKLAKHVKLCRRNLKSWRVKCCAECPFEEEITGVYPELKELYEAKRKRLRSKKPTKTNPGIVRANKLARMKLKTLIGLANKRAKGE